MIMEQQEDLGRVIIQPCHCLLGETMTTMTFTIPSMGKDFLYWSIWLKVEIIRELKNAWLMVNLSMLLFKKLKFMDFKQSIASKWRYEI